jgi:hypothetical protein
MADDELPLPQELRLPSLRLPVKPELTAPGGVIPPEGPDRLAGLRRTWGCWWSVGAVEVVVGHGNTILRRVTEEVSAGRFSCNESGRVRCSNRSGESFISLEAK